MTLQGERNAPFLMALQALSGGQGEEQPSGATPRGSRVPPRATGAPVARPPYSWWRPKKGRASIMAVHVEDPLGAMAAAGVGVGHRAPYRTGEGGKLERVAGIEGVGQKRRAQRV